MEGDEITIVLARASELRSKITNCIDKARRREPDEKEDRLDCSHSRDCEGDHEAEGLSSISDALESLEEQLASFKALQQQQRYEREASLAEIDRSRMILLKKIKEYNGEDLEVIHEVSAFASEAVEHNDDLLLPPYPSRAPEPLILDSRYPSSFSSARNFTQNGVIILDPIHKARKSTSELEKEQTKTPTRDSLTGLKFVFSVAAKTVLTMVSVASILSLAGFEPSLCKRSKQFKILDFFQKPSVEEKSAPIECPPGKVLVMEDGEPRCLVKERVEIPFEPAVTKPDVGYGCG